jgi:TP901 family phage tail tape measure protein
MDDFKTLLSVAYSIKQAQTETNKVIKEVQKNAKIQLDLDITDKEAKKVINETRKDYQNWWKTALSQESNLQKQKDNFNKKNLSAIDLEIKKRKEQSTQFSNQIKSQMLEAQKLAKAQQSAISLSQDRDTLKNRINSYVKNNPALKEMSSDFIKLRDSVEGLDKVGLSSANKEFRLLQSSAESLGKTGDTYFSKLGKNVQQFVGFLGSATVVMTGVNAIRNMITEVYNLDQALVDLQMATGYTHEQAKELLSTYIDLGKQMGATATEVAAAAGDYLRQGMTIAETNKLIKDSLVLAKLGNIDTAQATTYLTTAMKGYKVSVEDVIGIVDKLSAVDLESATDAGGLAEGMSEVANNARIAGVEMDKLLGYLAVIGETTGESMSSVGVGLNAIFSRMGNIKLARLKDYQNNGEDLSNVETVLSGLGIKLRDSVDQFRNFGDVLDEVATKWGSFSDVSQRALASAFAGTNHMEEFLVLMENYGTALNYSEVAANSAGTAMQKFGAYQESLEAKTKRLSASFQDLANDTIDSGIVKGFLDLSNFLINVTDNIGLLNIALVSLAGVMGAKTTAGINLFAQGLQGLASRMGATTALAGTMMSALSIALPVAAVLVAVAAYNHFNVTLEETRANLAKQKDAYDSEVSNVQSLTNELESTRKKLEELNSVGGAVVTKDGEKEKLQAQTEELQRQLDIAKETQRIAGLKAENTATEALSKKIESKYITGKVSNDYAGYDVTFDKVTRDVELERAINEYNKLAKSYEAVEKKQQDLANAQKGNSKEFKNNQKTLDLLNKSMSNARSYANELATGMQEDSNSLIGATVAGDNLKNVVDRSLNSYSSWTSSISSANDALGDTSDISSEVVSGIDSTTASVEDANKAIDAFQTSMSSIKNALSDVSSLSTNDIIDLMQEFKEFDWNSYGVTGVEGVGDLTGALKTLAKQQYDSITSTNGSSVAFSNLYQDAIKVKDGIQGISSSISSLDNLNSSLSSLDSAYASLISKQSVSLDDITKLNEVFGNTAGFNDFINTVSSAKSVTGDVQNAFNDLVTTYLYSSDILNTLTDDTKSLVITQLQHIGVSNAEEVVTSKLAEQKKILAETGLDVKDATVEEIIELINEGNVSDDTRNSLSGLAAQKLNVNNVALSTSGDIANLISLMSITNSTTEALQALQMAKEGKVPMSIARPGDMESMISRAQAEVESYYKGLGNSQNIKYTGGSKTSSVKDKASSKKTEFSQQIDQIARSVELAEKALSRLNEAIDDDAPYKKQITNLQALIKGQKELLSTYNKSATAYESQYNKSISGLSSKYVKQIQSGGTFKVQDFKGESGEKLYNQIITAQKYWDEYQNSLDKSNKTTKEIVENTEKLAKIKIDLKLDKFEKQKEKLSGLDDDIQNALDLVESGSNESVLLLQAGYKNASDSVANLKKEITALNKAYAGNKSDETYKTRLADLEEQLNSAASSMKSYKDQIIDAMKQGYEEQTDNLKDALDEQLDAIEKAHDAIIDSLNDQLDAYKEIIDAKKESLRTTEDEYQYQKKIAEQTNNINKINSRIAELSKAASSGDRAAAAEMKKLQDELAEAQSYLDDTQHDRKIELEEEALDKAYDDYEKLINGQIDLENKAYEMQKTMAQKAYDSKLANLTSLYTTEMDYIKQAAELTTSAFSEAFAGINQQLAQYGLSISSDLSGALFNTNSSLNTSLSSVSKTSSSSSYDPVLKLLKNGTGTTGNSNLNKYISSNYGSYLTFSEMLQLAKLMGVSGISSLKDVEESGTNRNKILDALKSSGYKNGGILGEVNSTIKGMGEDALFVGSKGESVLTEPETKAYRMTGGYLAEMVNLLKAHNLNPANYSNNTNNSPNIQIESLLTVQGNVNKDVVNDLNASMNSLVEKVSDDIMKKMRKF